MSKTAIEVITSVQRRRRWGAAEKERLVAASLEPGASVSRVGGGTRSGDSSKPAVRMATAAVPATAARCGVYGGADCDGANNVWAAGCWHDRHRVRERIADADHGGG